MGEKLDLNLNQSNKENELTIEGSDLLPDVAIIVVLLEIEDRITRRAITAAVKFENFFVLV